MYVYTIFYSFNCMYRQLKLHMLLYGYTLINIPINVCLENVNESEKH